MAEVKPKLRVDVNHNPTKKGVKVQFVLPQTLEGDAKAQATQKLQSKLNQGLEQYNLTVSQDTDVPYSNVIGFLIPIADIKLLIKNAIGGGAAPEEEAPAEPPAEEPAPEEPVKEIKRMQELAGLLREFSEDKLRQDIANLKDKGKVEQLLGTIKSKIVGKTIFESGKVIDIFIAPSSDEDQTVGTIKIQFEEGNKVLMFPIWVNLEEFPSALVRIGKFNNNTGKQATPEDYDIFLIILQTLYPNSDFSKGDIKI